MLSHIALRELAEDLVKHGFCVVRLDYDGTGDSAGTNQDSDRVDAWLQTIRFAVDTLKKSGVKDISLVGMRFGATLAAEVAGLDGEVDQIVLWDPHMSGRSFLVEQHAMSVLNYGVPVDSPDGSVEIPGIVFDKATAAAMREINIVNQPDPLARRALVLTRSDRPPNPQLMGRKFGRQAVSHQEAAGQAELLERRQRTRQLPVKTIETISAWLAEGASDRWQPLRVPKENGPATVGYDTTGVPILETAVRLPPVGLFGILTERADSGTAGTPALFLGLATEFHHGPARQWVELSRRWAAAGMRCLRLDLSGLGESPHRYDKGRPWVSNKPEAFEDVVDAARWISPADPSNVVLVGLSASGYQVLDSALALRPRAVVALNPSISFMPPEYVAGLPLDQRRRIALPKDALSGSLREGGGLSAVRERFPDLAWRLRILATPRRRSGRWLKRLVRHGTDTLIVSGDHEYRSVRQGTTALGLRKLERTGLLRIERFRGLQHALLVASQREALGSLISEHVLTRFSNGVVSARSFAQNSARKQPADCAEITT